MANLYWPTHLLRNEKRQQARRLSRWKGAEKAAKTTLLLSHGNCLDGVGAAIVTLRTLGRDNVGVCYLHPNDMGAALEFFSQFPANGRKLLVADLSLQPEQLPAIVAAITKMRSAGWTIEWRDHHHKQWENLDLGPLRAELAVLEVNADATQSGASLQQKALAPLDGFLLRLSETIRDRDLWWNKTPDSETLEFALSELGTKRFVAAYLAAATDAPTVLPEIAAAAEREKSNQAAILGTILAGTRFFGAGKTRIGVVYGWLPKNTGLHEILTDHDCRVAINVRPNGKVSLRSRKEIQVCHLIAREFSGGGHPNASGADLGLKGMAYWWYVLRRGRVGQVAKLVEISLHVLGQA